ncbi:MAG TPA: DUF3419 domain-containing protein [Planctomycetaceae bacterium]|nr:DUF3419 domain-containing protein [Planctomycetaceae bacterium]
MKRLSDWVSGRIFKMVHGRNLVYNTCWEDPRLDKEVLELAPEDNLLVITSAGCNALSYVLTGLNHVYAVDMNYRQNALLELKIAGIRNLDYETFFRMFGQGRLPHVREIYNEKLRDSLSDAARKYWDRRIKKFFGNRRRSFYFRGTSGTVARYVNMYADRIKRLRPLINELLAAETVEEQQEIWFNKIKVRLWSRLIRFIFNRDTTLSMLGVPKAQRMQIDKQYPGGIVKFIEDCLDAVLGTLSIRDNYFWRVYATGSYTPTCCPEYLERENFDKLKAGLVDRISVHTATVEGFLRTHDVKISRFVLLDHMDWLSHHLYDALVAEWDAILERAAEKTRILWRSGGLRTEYIDSVPVVRDGKNRMLGELLTMHPEKAAELHQKDRVHTYGSFYIADLTR